MGFGFTALTLLLLLRRCSASGFATGGLLMAMFDFLIEMLLNRVWLGSTAADSPTMWFCLYMPQIEYEEAQKAAGDFHFSSLCQIGRKRPPYLKKGYSSFHFLSLNCSFSL